MGIIDYLHWTKVWNTNINNKKDENCKKANYIVIFLIIFFVGLFVFVSTIGIYIVRLLINFLKDVFPSFQMNDLQWMIYGLTAGIAFSFFLQAVPQRSNPDETPANLWGSFTHQFSYFCVCIVAIFFWSFIIISVIGALIGMNLISV